MSERVDAKRFVVVGGGITGLAAALRIADRTAQKGIPAAIRVLESSNRIGGQIRTERLDEFLLDGGPDTLVAQKPAALRLAQRVGFEDQVVPVTGAKAGSEIVRRGQRIRVPDGFLMMAPARLGPVLRSPLFSAKGKLRMALEPWVRPRDAGIEDESLESFVTRRFGREVFERIAEPMIAGLYLARAESLSLRLTLPRFLDMERSEGSVTRALRTMKRNAARRDAESRPAPFLTVRGGIGRLVQAVETRLPAGCIATGARVASLEHDRASGTWRVACRDGEVLDADAVVLASPAHASAAILRRLDAGLAELLGELEFASCATVTLGYRSSGLKAKLSSYGFFVPRTEGLPLIACSYLSVKFPERSPTDRVVLRAFLGGALQPEILEQSDEELRVTAHAALRPLLRLTEEPVFVRVHRFIDAMPQFRTGQATWVADVQDRASRHAGLYLAGSASGVHGVPDSIQSGEAAADRAVDEIARSQRPALRAVI